MNNWKRSFAFIWTGQLFSLQSSAIVNFAIILWISIETQSAMILALRSIGTTFHQPAMQSSVPMPVPKSRWPVLQV